MKPLNIALLLIAALLPLIPTPRARACEPARVVVQNRQVVAVQTVAVVPAVVLQPIAVQVPQYQVSYDANCETALLRQELASLRAEIRSLRAPALQQPQQRENVPTPKETATPTRGDRGRAILAARCASCHGAGDGAARGGKHVFFDQTGKILDLEKNAGPMLEAVDGDAAHPARMPKTGPKLTGDELASAVWALSVVDDAPPPAKPPVPPADPKQPMVPPAKP
jgi:mono/diheme cytochrome c family protein